MTVCGGVWLCVAVCGYAWMCVVVFGCVRLCVVLCGCVWLYVAVCGRVSFGWTFINSCPQELVNKKLPRMIWNFQFSNSTKLYGPQNDGNLTHAQE